jgi:hypothetical protein
LFTSNYHYVYRDVKLVGHTDLWIQGTSDTVPTGPHLIECEDALDGGDEIIIHPPITLPVNPHPLFANNTCLQQPTPKCHDKGTKCGNRCTGPGGSCQQLADLFGLTLAKFQALNPTVLQQTDQERHIYMYGRNLRRLTATTSSCIKICKHNVEESIYLVLLWQSRQHTALCAVTTGETGSDDLDIAGWVHSIAACNWWWPHHRLHLSAQPRLVNKFHRGHDKVITAARQASTHATEDRLRLLSTVNA